MIQFRTLFLSVFGLFMMACAREEIIVSETSVQDTPIGMQAQKGRLRLKFKSRFAGKAEQAVYTRAGTGDIRIVSMKRLFPFAGKFEERTRKAGLHLWYEVEFDEQTPVTRALALLGDTTEIEIAEPVYIIRNTGGEGTVPVRSAGERNSDGTAPFNDPELSGIIPIPESYRILWQGRISIYLRPGKKIKGRGKLLWRSSTEVLITGMRI